MTRQTSAWARLGKTLQRERLIEWVWVLGLLLAAIALLGVNLGEAALRDWDEGTVAQVAREIVQAPFQSLRWLFPTLNDAPYLNKPPLVHWLIAGLYKVFGENEWTSRLPGALLTAISVPLLYGVGREIFAHRTWAIFSSLVYLTMLPVMRHGRLAMLDGAVLGFGLLMVWCVLRSRRNLRYCLGVGVGLGLICLTKGIVGVLLFAVALVFLAWDTPRLLTCGYLWGGVILGSLPVAAWYGAQLWHYKEAFVQTGLVGQSLQRIWTPVEGNKGPIWYYLLEILKYSAPWIVFFPMALRQAWEHRNWSWAKLVLVWSGAYFVAISAMSTKLPWYVLPIYPPLALAVGAMLGEIWQGDKDQPFPRLWSSGLAVMGVAAIALCLYFSVQSDRALPLILAAAALTLTVAAVLIVQRDLQFIPILFWGTFVTLLLFMTSPHWLWELNEAFPVKPVAAIVRLGTPKGKVIYTSFEYRRPSLDFYSDRQVLPATDTQLKEHWQQDPQPYLLLSPKTLQQLNFKAVKKVGTAPNWVLITRQFSLPRPKTKPKFQPLKLKIHKA